MKFYVLCISKQDVYLAIDDCYDKKYIFAVRPSQNVFLHYMKGRFKYEVQNRWLGFERLEPLGYYCRIL